MLFAGRVWADWATGGGGWWNTTSHFVCSAKTQRKLDPTEPHKLQPLQVLFAMPVHRRFTLKKIKNYPPPPPDALSFEIRLNRARGPGRASKQAMGLVPSGSR
jgi:hypothetical protein